MRLVPALLVLLLLASCAEMPGPPPAAVTAAKDSGRDGSSIEQAIVIDARTEFTGIDDEDYYLQKSFPGYEKVGQALIESNGRQYDRIDIITGGGKQKTFYFDITSFFGR